MNPHEEKPDLTKESAPQPESAESLAGLLHANRLRKGLSLQDVADLTKYSKWQLEALETKTGVFSPVLCSVHLCVIC